MEDPGDVLGNLPRTRPGRRSAKRDSSQAPVSSRQERPAATAAAGSDPVGDAIRTAAGIAGAGLRVADGVTREILRRIPRP